MHIEFNPSVFPSWLERETKWFVTRNTLHKLTVGCCVSVKATSVIVIWDDEQQLVSPSSPGIEDGDWSFSCVWIWLCGSTFAVVSCVDYNNCSFPRRICYILASPLNVSWDHFMKMFFNYCNGSEGKMCDKLRRICVLICLRPLFY